MSGSPDEVEPSPEERSQAQKAAEEWNDYYQNYRPAENILIDSVRATPDKVGKARGIAATNVGLQYDGALDNAQAGFSGNAGRGLRALSGMRDSMSGTKGAAIGNATNAVENQELQGLIRMGGFGRGLGNIATDSLGNAAAQSSASAIGAARADQQMNQIYGNAAGQAVGFGVNQWQKSNDQFVGPPSHMAGG